MSVTAFKHACRLYAAMAEEAEIEIITGIDLLIYRGKVTHLYNGLGISQSYYSLIFRTLTSLGCMTQIEKGSRLDGSVYVLHHEPTKDEWTKASAQPLTKPVDVVVLAQRLENLSEQLKGVDIGELIAEVTELKERLRQLEERVEQHGKATKPVNRDRRERKA